MAQTFDEAELLDRVDNDVGFLAETVEMLTADGPSLVRSIAEAVNAGDAAAVGRDAHALKGMISNFCAPAAHASALALEQAGKQGDLGAAPELLRALEERVAALTEELLRFVRERS